MSECVCVCVYLYLCVCVCAYMYIYKDGMWIYISEPLWYVPAYLICTSIFNQPFFHLSVLKRLGQKFPFVPFLSKSVFPFIPRSYILISIKFSIISFQLCYWFVKSVCWFLLEDIQRDTHTLTWMKRLDGEVMI